MKQAKESKLIPCPWKHKGKPKVARSKNTCLWEVGYSYYVKCGSRRCDVRPRTDYYATRAEAIAAWNDRRRT